MARNSRTTRTRTRTRNSRGSSAPRPLPWVILGAASTLASTRDERVRPADRARLVALVARAQGRGLNLTLRERTELAAIVGRAEAAPAPRTRTL